jgi:hypothetical protein
MIGWVLGVSPAQMEALRASPDLAGEVAVAAETGRMGGGPAPVDAMGPMERPLGLEKSWHMMHYMFTGSTEPAGGPGDALMGGEELGEDFGYGPARLLDAEATRAFGDFLNGIDFDRMKARIDSRKMTDDGVYAVSDDDDEVRQEFAEYFPRLRDYVAGMAHKQGGLLVWIS